MCSESTVEHEDKHRDGMFREAAEESAPMAMLSQAADWMWARDTFFPGRGVESRLQCWVYVYVCVPGPQGNHKKKNMGHFLPLTHGGSLSFLSLSLSLPHYIFNYQVRSEAHYLGESFPLLLSYWQLKWTKSICGDLNLLMPLASCMSNHPKRKQREVPQFRCFLCSLFCADLLPLGYLAICGHVLIESRVFHTNHDHAVQHVTHHRGCIWFHY